jgi:hypothetical protein
MWPLQESCRSGQVVLTMGVIMNRIGVLLLALALQACAGTRTADLDIGEHSYFLVDVPPQTAAFGQVRLVMARYDRATNTASDWEYDIPRSDGSGTQWHAIAVSPGEYVLLSLGVFQRRATWSACFGEATYSYSIGENEIVYLGTLDANPSLQMLDQQVEAEGRTRASTGQFRFVHQNIPRPSVVLEQPSADALARAQDTFKSRYPDKQLPMRWRPPTPATFATAPNALRMVNCGG